MNRVSGTAGNAIELGVAAAIVLPLAIYMAIHDTERSVRARWLPVPLIALAVPVSVSRSAIVGLAITIGFLIVLMPVRQRLVALAVVPIALAGVFMTAHGLIGTLVSYFGLGDHDSSISHRTNNYPYVEHVVRQAPLFGHGGGTHINDGTEHRELLPTSSTTSSSRPRSSLAWLGSLRWRHCFSCRCSRRSLPANEARIRICACCAPR